MNREEWLTTLAKQVENVFKDFTLSPYRLTCGWPSTGGLSKNTRVGECFGPKSSKAKVFEIFVSPLLDKPLEVAGTVCHELAHVAAGIEAKHGKGFIAVAQHIGLTKGKPITAMPGKALNRHLDRIIEGIGDYPHQAIITSVKIKLKVKSTVKLVCPKCGFSVTASLKKLDDVPTYPTCGCKAGALMEPEEKESEDA
jgi:ribosomal protein L44E